MGSNTASGKDEVGFQIGKVTSKKDAPKSESKDRGDTFSNNRSGNARVGRQVDSVRGPINL